MQISGGHPLKSGKLALRQYEFVEILRRRGQGNRRIGKDIIAGSFFIVGEDGDEFRSLTDEEVKESLKRFAEPEEISQEEVENAMSAGVMFFG